MNTFEFESDSEIILTTQIDFVGEDFYVFDEPIEYFDISTLWSRIASFEQITYIAEIFLYLNPDIDYNIFKGVFNWLGNRENGRTVRTYSKARIAQMTEEVYERRNIPFCRRVRRVIFNPDRVISLEQKLEIAGQLTKRGIVFTKIDVISASEHLNRAKIKITADSIATHLGCSSRTVLRLLDSATKKRFKTMNQKIKREKQITSVLEWIEVLTSDNSLKMRELKKLTNVRDYSIIKEAINRYESGY